MEKEKTMKDNTNHGPPYQVAAPQPKPTEEVSKPVEPEPTPEPLAPTVETQTITLKETLSIGKLICEEEECTPFEQCVKDGGSPEECARKFKETAKHNSNNKAICKSVNEIIDALNKPVSVAVPDWSSKITAMQQAIENKLTSVASEIVTVTNKWNSEVEALTEKIEAIPKDEWKQPLTEAIAAIKPYDDAAIKTSMETLGKTLMENLAQMTQKMQLLETEHGKVKEMYEKNLAAFEKDIKEYYKPLETRTQELEKRLAETTQKLTVADKTLQETKTLAENANDKLKPEFKGNSKKVVVEQATTPISYNPYGKVG